MKDQLESTSSLVRGPHVRASGPSRPPRPQTPWLPPDIWRQTFSSTVFSKFLTTQRHFFISTGVHFFLAVVFLIVRHCFLGTSIHSCLVTSLCTGLVTGIHTFLATSLHTGLETVLQTSRGTLRQLFFPPHFSSPAAQRLQYWPGRPSSSVQEQGRGAQLG